MTIINITNKWIRCEFQMNKNGRLYCKLKETYCKPENCKEQMMK